MYRAIEIARYIISKCTTEKRPISNLQLQKILYYVQKEFLNNGGEAFSDEFEAWQFGPVVPEVYRQFCGFGAMAITMSYNVSICSEYARIINPIVEKKRILDPWTLVEDTHKPEKAWAEIYRCGLGNHHVIPKNLIRNKG